MECEVDPEMTITAVTNAKWYVEQLYDIQRFITHTLYLLTSTYYQVGCAWSIDVWS
jgi:hypothetical protein